MTILTRRSALIGALFAPAISRLPGLLMPVSPRLTPQYDTVLLFDDKGGQWEVPIIDNSAMLKASRSMIISSGALVKNAHGEMLHCYLTSGRMLELRADDSLCVRSFQRRIFDT